MVDHPELVTKVFRAVMALADRKRSGFWDSIRGSLSMREELSNPRFMQDCINLDIYKIR